MAVIPEKVEVEDGATKVSLQDFIAAQQRINAMIDVLAEERTKLEGFATTIENHQTAVADQIIEAVNQHAGKDTDVHGAVGALEEHVAKLVGGGTHIFYKYGDTSTPQGRSENDLWARIEVV